MIIKPELVEAFDNAIKHYLQKIADAYLCHLKKKNDLSFYLTHDNYFIKIEFFESHEPSIIVTIHPNRNIYKRLGNEWYGLGFIAGVLAPNSDFGPIKFKTQKDVFLSIEKQSQILVKCCDKMLKGDFSQWRQLNKIFKNKLEKNLEQRRQQVKKIKFKKQSH